VRFWFTPADPVGLHVLRLLTGLLLLAWLLPFAGHLDSLFGLQGWFDQRAYAQAAAQPEGMFPPISWSIINLTRGNPALLTQLYWTSLGVIALFTLGVASRLTGVLTWVVVVSFTANPAIDYDGDAFLRILSFYLMVGYLLIGQRGPLSLPARLLGSADCLLVGRRGVRPSVGANLAVRLLQVHFALVVLTTGLHKLQSGAWWSGVAIWFALYPPLETTLEAARTHSRHVEAYHWFLNIATYSMLAWQILFLVFAWRPRWRVVLLGGAVIGWVGTAFIWHLPLIGPAMLIGCLSYLTTAEWQRVLELLGPVPGLGRLAGQLPARAEMGRDETPTGVRTDARMPRSETRPRSEAIMSRSPTA
jgi:hypothetical protein